MKIFDKIVTILRELCGGTHFSAEQSLQKDLGLDSMQMVTLLLLVEEAFEILLDEADMNPFDLVLVGDVIALAKKYVGGKEDEKENV